MGVSSEIEVTANALSTAVRRRACKYLVNETSFLTRRVFTSVSFIRVSKNSGVYYGQNVRSRTGAGMAECIAVLGSDYQYVP